ncbi:hypothetical protein MASR2M47_17390 [Draconibacterium sp.]|jgi:hypothetical protein
MTEENIKVKEKIIEGLEKTYKKLIKNKIDRNFDLVISDNGKVSHIDPKEYKE